MAKLLFGTFSDRTEADEAVAELEEAGVSRGDFSVIGRAGATGAAQASVKVIKPGNGLAGALMGLGIPRETARRQEAVVRDGGILLSAEDNEVSEQELRECFGRHGAEEIVLIEHAGITARLAALGAE